VTAAADHALAWSAPTRSIAQRLAEGAAEELLTAGDRSGNHLAVARIGAFALDQLQLLERLGDAG